MHKLRVQDIILSSLIITYFLVFSTLSISQHNHFETFNFDLGVQDQGIWLLSQFKEPFLTTRGLGLFSEHSFFIDIIIAPIYWLWDDVRAILIFQSLVLALGALPLYWISNQKLKNKWYSLAIIISYFLYPAMHYLNLEMFHPDSISVATLLFAFYFITKKMYKSYFASIFFSLLIKETIALTIMVMGIYIFFKHNKKIGAVTSTIALIYLMVIFGWFFGYINGEGYIFGTTGHNAFNSFGKTPLEAIKNIILNPGRFLSVIFTEINGKYVYDIFMPVGFLFFFDSTFSLFIPALFLNLFTGWSYAHSIQYHYTNAIIPFVFVSIIYSVAFLKEKVKLKYIGIFLIIYILLFSLLGNFYLGPRKSSIRYPDVFFDKLTQVSKYSEKEKAFYEGLRLIPEGEKVSASYNLVPHISHREYIYMFPNPYKNSYLGLPNEVPPKVDIDYIIIDKTVINPKEEMPIIDNFLKEKAFALMFEKGDLAVFKKSSSNEVK